MLCAPAKLALYPSAENPHIVSTTTMPCEPKKLAVYPSAENPHIVSTTTMPCELTKLAVYPSAGTKNPFPMYDNDFGWGKPVAVRSGRANKFDGKISAFPGREGGGSVDLEVVLSPETMAELEMDEEFMQYVSVSGGC
ncbi:putative transferase [Helianthus annuus]|nr:putative transferase [Helianthus annuus]